MTSPAAGPVLVISPHLDDGVFGCAETLAAHPGSVVLTVFAGRPAAGGPSTPWDAASGFVAGDDVVALRRQEDLAALARLGAQPLWLDFRDAQYGSPPSVAALTEALAQAIHGTGIETALLPLGLGHPDHRLTHAAALAVLGRYPALRACLYAEAIYRLSPGAVDQRLAALAAGFETVRLATAVTTGLRREAVRCYASQLRALAADSPLAYADAFAPERCWRLTPRTPAYTAGTTALPRATPAPA